MKKELRIKLSIAQPYIDAGFLEYRQHTGGSHPHKLICNDGSVIPLAVNGSCDRAIHNFRAELRRRFGVIKPKPREKTVYKPVFNIPAVEAVASTYEYQTMKTFEEAHLKPDLKSLEDEEAVLLAQLEQLRKKRTEAAQSFIQAAKERVAKLDKDLHELHALTVATENELGEARVELAKLQGRFVGTFETAWLQRVTKVSGGINVKATCEKLNLDYGQFLKWVKENHPGEVAKGR